MAAPSVNPKWIEDQLNLYLNKEKPAYDAMATLLEAVLQKACQQVAPHSIVQARVKSATSFVGKCVLKGQRYPKPAFTMPDLCGARVIVNTLDEIKRVCQLCEKWLVVESGDIEDTIERLEVDQFGYRSVHLRVSIDAERLPHLPGIDVDSLVAEIHASSGDSPTRPRTAELQIRTLLQHVWCDVTHDRVYKTKLRIPKSIHREFYQLAAELEASDHRFNSLCRNIDLWQGPFAAYSQPSEIETQLEHETSLENAMLQLGADGQAELQEIYLRKAQLFRALGRYQALVDLPSVDVPGKHDPLDLYRAIGICHTLASQSIKANFVEAQQTLSEFADAPIQTDYQLLACEELAWVKQELGHPAEEVLALREQVWHERPENPYTLKEYAEAAILASRSDGCLPFLKPALQKAITASNQHLSLGIESLAALFAKAQLQLLAGQQSEALETYLTALSLDPNSACLLDEQRSVQRLAVILPEWAHALTILELFQTAKQAKPTHESEPVLILVGNSSQDFSASQYSSALSSALDGYTGKVYCGGTDSGLPKLMGEIAADKKDHREWTLTGWLPEHLPEHVVAHKGYDVLETTTGASAFSVAEPLNYWKALIDQGIDPSAIQVLCIGGGAITRFESLLAATMGATVGLWRGSGGEADRIATETPRAGIIQLPDDAATVWSFLRARTPYASMPQFEAAARSAHLAYVETRKAKEISQISNAHDWNHLPEDFRRSNRHQAAFAAEILAAHGYRVTPLADTGESESITEFPPKEVEAMAEKEHGRWCVERLSQGWRFGSPRDNDKKIHPDLIPWKDLKDSTRDYDRSAIRSLPKVLGEAGLAIR